MLRKQFGEGSCHRRGSARPHRARAARPCVSRRRGFHRRGSHGRGAAGRAPAASRDSVSTAGGAAGISEGLPRHVAAASGRAMGGRHLSPASRILERSCQANSCAVAFRKWSPVFSFLFRFLLLCTTQKCSMSPLCPLSGGKAEDIYSTRVLLFVTP